MRAKYDIVPGFALRFATSRFPPPQLWGLNSVAEPGAAGPTIAMVVATVGEMAYAWGSAVLVAPGVALSAGHTFLGHEEQGHLAVEPSAVFLTAETPTGLLSWIVLQVSYVGSTDVAVLSVEPAFDLSQVSEITFAEISTRLPSIGEPVHAVGFRAGESEWLRKGDTFSIANDLLVTVGRVTGHYLDGLGISRPGETLECEMDAIGGMSGGPVFDQNGFLVGLVSRSMAPFDNGPATTWVSLLWRALLSKVDLKWPPQYYRNAVALREIAYVDEPKRLRPLQGGASYEYSSDPNLNEADELTEALHVAAWRQQNDERRS